MNEKAERQIIHVCDVMKPKVDFIDGMETIATALRMMQHVQNKCLIVNKRHEDDEFGVLLISDIARKVLAVDKAPERVNVYEIMAKPVISVDSRMDVRYCARLFDRFDISRAPVIEDGQVIGIVSFTDLVLKGMDAA